MAQARRIDVAQRAGTSPAVVSYVLNGGPRPVSREARARVLAAVAELGYRPNGIARSLRMSRSTTLGLVVPDTANPFFAHLARAIEDAAFAAGYTLLLGNAAENAERQATYIRTFLARQVDGLFVVPAHGSALPEELADTDVPWVTLDRELSDDRGGAVLVDNRAGAAVATQHLVDHGRTRIACIAGPHDVRTALERVGGWRDAMTLAGLEAADGAISHGSFGRRAGREQALSLFSAPAGYDAVFVASDEQAIGVLRALHELGLSCPDDVAVVSFDGIAETEVSTPTLTTMAQPFAALGEAAVGDLLERIGDPERPAGRIDLPARLVLRESCGCAPIHREGGVA